MSAKPESVTVGAESILLDELKKKGQSDGQSGVSRIWVILAVVFCLATFGLVGVVIWRETLPRETEIVTVERRFPGFFRSSQQQTDFMEQYFNATKYKVVNETTYGNRVNDTSYANIVNTNGTGFLRRRRRNTELHACCETQISFKAEPFLLNMLGQKRKIAQFSEINQFFKFEKCRLVAEYPSGICIQKPEFVTAVIEEQGDNVDDDLKYMIDWVEVLGCCKCINVNRRP